MTEEQKPEDTEEMPSILCIGCAKPIPEESEFCPLCGAPLGATVWTDPYKQVFANGHITRRFTSGTPRKWTMIAEMVMAGLFVPLNVFMLLQERTPGNTLGMAVTLSITGVFYYRLIKNYIRVYGKRNGNEAPNKATRLRNPRRARLLHRVKADVRAIGHVRVTGTFS